VKVAFQEGGEKMGAITIALASGYGFRVPGGTIREARASRATAPTYVSKVLNPELESHSEPDFEGIVGQSPALRQVLEYAETVAATDSTVLLLGETGTGKELIARAIHNLGRRKDRPLVKLNCAAIPSGLLESELFGHERGAFTGAIAPKMGRLELADEGTLFLDEVGDIPLELQPKLLRVMQEREFERLGSSRTKKVDVRIVAATHRDLEGMMQDRQFRSDLYYRLNVFPISLPPLRARRDDIPLLVWHFVEKYSQQMDKCIDRIPEETIEALTRYHWPGNIRELQNVIERAVILTQGTILHVPLENLERHSPFDQPSRAMTLKEAERQHILRTLDETQWVIGGAHGAAARLGVPRTSLIYRMQKLGIPRRRDLCVAFAQSREMVHTASMEIFVRPTSFRRPPFSTAPVHPIERLD
jgi:formate hydrogenlyase transcriptional activator